MSATSIERINVPVPAGFDPQRHTDALLKQVAQRHGTGWTVGTFDPDKRVLAFERGRALTQVQDRSTATKTVGLSGVPRPSDGDKYAAKLQEQYPGFYMTSFDPFLARAELTKLTDAEVRCRGAVAVALGVKPWDVTVKARRDGGYDIGLPKTYQPSKHDDKLEEVATGVVGMFGWYVTTDPKKLTATINPSDPPTFPKVIPFPLARLGKGDSMATPFGMVLPAPGDDTGPDIVIDWRASGSCLVTGLSGGGKSVAITAILADRVSNGAQLAVIDTPDKAVDFLKFKDLCAVTSVDGSVIPTWGCDSFQSAVAVLAMLVEEGQKRAQLLSKLGINNWLDMPKSKAFAPVFVIADEYEALTAKVPEPKALPKDHPIRVDAMEENIAHELIAHFANRLIKEFRFVGIHVLLASQISNASSGLPPSTKGKMGHFILCGSTPSEPARKQAFPDERSVPRVPDNVASGGMVSKGTGSAKLEGQAGAVFKSFFASVDDYDQALRKLNLPRYSEKQVTPSAQQIDKYVPRLDDADGDDRPAQSRPAGERAPSGKPAAQVAAEMGDTYGMALHDGSLGETAFERANAARHAAAGGGQTRKQKREASEEAAWAAKSGDATATQMDKCPSCDSWIHPVNGCRCQA